MPEPMPDIRLVAVDEDGTMLDATGEGFDRARFGLLFSRMEAAGCHFVVATGNQVYQVRTIFSEVADRIGYVTHNGAFVFDGMRLVAKQTVSRDAYVAGLAALSGIANVVVCACGLRGAYMRRGGPQEGFDEMRRYCPRISWVDSLESVDDEIGIISCVASQESTQRAIDAFNDAAGGAMVAVCSGYEYGMGYFDAVPPQVSKATGLQALMRVWGVSPNQVLAFGDSGNDVSMLRLAGRGFAMANGTDDAKAAADEICPANTEGGVLQVLERYFPEVDAASGAAVGTREDGA